MSDRGALSLGERLEIEAALDVAFEPLRGRRTDLSARRVRAAVRWGRGAPPPPTALPWSGAVARLSELSVAVGMCLLIFTAGFESAVLPGDQVSDGGVVPQPTLTEQRREMLQFRLDWLEFMRASSDAQPLRGLLPTRIGRYLPLQDWLDPAVVRPTPRYEQPPTPSLDGVLAPGPY